MSVTEYDTSKNYLITADKYYSLKPQDPNDLTYFRPYIVKNDGFVRMHFMMLSGTLNLNLLGGCFSIISKTDERNTLAIEEYILDRKIQSRKPTQLPSSLINGQDGTFVNGKLWSFADGVSVGNINVIDLETLTHTTKTHNLGHANSVDYNPNVDCLMTFGSNGSNQPTIVLYKEPDTVTDLRLTDAKCTIINLYNISEHFNISGSVCWGEANCIAYFVTGVYEDSSYTPIDTRKIIKLLLGMGSNDLSGEGFGTFISGRSNTEYNGTCKILKTYYGEIPYIDTKYGRANLETPQGMEYDKYLYLGYGTRGHNILKIALDDDSNSYRVVDNYYVNMYSYSGALLYFEPEMVALNGAHLFTGSILSTDKMFYKISK